jgi:hypothetical protein
MIDRLCSVRVLASLAILCVALGAPARADLIITGGSATVAPGGTATVDFTVSATAGSSYQLGSFQIELQITTSSGTSFLQFSSSQVDPYSDSVYVFSGASFGQDYGVPFWGNPFDSNRSNGTHNDTIVGGDSNDGISGYTLIDVSSHYLLGSVTFQADPHASNGDSYTIAVVNDPGQTYFLAPDPDVFAYTSTPGTVTIHSSQNPGVVPEPASAVLVGLGSVTCLLYSWRIRRRRRAGAADSAARE